MMRAKYKDQVREFRRARHQRHSSNIEKLSRVIQDACELREILDGSRVCTENTKKSVERSKKQEGEKSEMRWQEPNNKVCVGIKKSKE